MSDIATVIKLNGIYFELNYKEQLEISTGTRWTDDVLVGHLDMGEARQLMEFLQAWLDDSSDEQQVSEGQS